MGVVTIVKASLNNLDIVLCYLRLLGELLTKEVCNEVEVAVEKPAHYSQRKHVAALQYCLVVHSTVGKTVFYHLSQRALHHAVGIDAHLTKIVLGLELSLLQILWAKAVGVDDYRSLWLGIFILCFQGCRIHCHQDVALVTRRIYTSGTNVNLKS